jgi:LmbE family N-acetylglucosaminyl deacetylase
MKRFLSALFFVLAALHAMPAGAQDTARAGGESHQPIRALLIVAHPDDEYEMAGTIYRITTELSGTVDQVIITDGEAGYRYSSLAARYYGVNLTNEATGRARLPHIREEEARRAARILGIRRQWFLNERDDHFTLDVQDALKSWRTERILAELEERLRKGDYDVVFVLLPTEDTHGQHKAASILALEAVESLPANQRPAVVGADATPGETESYRTLSGYPITAANSAEPQFHFDRDVHFGFHDSLSYEIVVDWVIAEHKSQGLFQTKCGQDRFENFWVFALSGASGAERTAALFERISPRSQTIDRAVDRAGNAPRAKAQQ